MHERTQRKVCRTAFVVCCLMPTLLTIGWTMYLNRPWHEQDWQQALESALHVRINVGQVSAPRPQELEVTSLKIASLHSNQVLLDLNHLKVLSGRAFLADRIRVHWSKISEIAQTIEIWQAGDTNLATKWQINSLVIENESGQACELFKVRVATTISPHGSKQLTLLAETEQGQQIQMLVERTTDGISKCTVDAQHTVLPAWLLAESVPGATRWENATFTGMLTISKTPSQIAGQFHGSVSEIDTHDWTGTNQIRTNARLQLQEFTWSNDRIERVQGSLHAGAGEIDRMLFGLLKEKLQCFEPPGMQIDKDVYAFDQAACRFEISKSGLNIVGACSNSDEDASNCLLSVDSRALLLQPAYCLPLGQLIQIFCPLDKSWLPATRKATDMAGKLPMPEADTTKK